MHQIKSDYSNLKTFVINLDDYIENYNVMKPYLEYLGLKFERFSAINALKNEHLEKQFVPFISIFAKHFAPKSVIGCSLSHILCCKHILENVVNNNKNELTTYLILEDDVVPLLNRADFYKELNKSLYEITLLDSGWDIIQLHSDAFFPTNETFITHFFCGSTAAYLISEKGLNKMLRQKVCGHLDCETQNFIRFNKYRVKHNFFRTNEKTSLNRVIQDKYTYNFNNMSLLVKAKIIEQINTYIVSIPLRGEKSYANFLEFKMLAIPYSNREYTVNELIDCLVGFFIYSKMIKTNLNKCY